ADVRIVLGSLDQPVTVLEVGQCVRWRARVVRIVACVSVSEIEHMANFVQNRARRNRAAETNRAALTWKRALAARAVIDVNVNGIEIPRPGGSVCRGSVFDCLPV